jgi:hypothetical protein
MSSGTSRMLVGGDRTGISYTVRTLGALDIIRRLGLAQGRSPIVDSRDPSDALHPCFASGEQWAGKLDSATLPRDVFWRF